MASNEQTSEADNSGPSDRATDLRRRRSEVSRQAIRDAVAELLRTEHPSTLSIPAVAAAAGVSVRTVYRYFPTKQDLLEDVSQVQQRRADALLNGREDMYDNPGHYLSALWSGFEEDVEAIRAQHISPAGAELRNTRLEKIRTGAGIRFDKIFPDATEQDRRDLADIVIMMTSSAAFLDLHSRLGHSGADAADLAWWAASAVQQKFAEDGGINRQNKPVPEQE